MRSVFGLFENYVDADAAVADLLTHDFERDVFNVIVLENVAKTGMDVRQEEVKVRKTDDVGDKTVGGLPAIVGGLQATHVPNLGQVYAAGPQATTLVRAASHPGSTGDGLAAALKDFAVPGDVAEAYATTINNGGVLLWLHVDKTRVSEAANVLRANNGKHVGNYESGSPRITKEA